MTALRRCLCLLLLLLPVYLWAATAEYCYLQSIKVEEIANGLRIRLQADGLFDVSCNPGQARYSPQSRILFTLHNLRGGASSMHQIGQYPVSHLEFAPPKETDDSVKMECALVLYQPGRLVDFSGKPYDWNDTSWVPTDLPLVMMNVTRQGNEMLITVLSDRPGSAFSRPAFTPAPTELVISGDQTHLYLHAVNADLSQTVQRIAVHTGTALYVDNNVSRQVTAHLDGPLTRVLTHLATGYGLSLSKRDGAYYFSAGMLETAPAYWAASTRTVPLRYLLPERTRTLMPDVVLPAMQEHSDANAIAVSGPSVLVDKIVSDLQVLDQPFYQCRLRAWVVSTEATEEMRREVRAVLGAGTTRLEASSTGLLRLEIGTRQAHEVLLNLQSLAQHRTLRIEAVPSIMVLNGRWAELFVGQKIYYWKLVGSGDQEIALSSVEAGTYLHVTPRTSGEWITLAINVSSNYLSEINALGPLIQQRTAKSTLRIRSGDTLIIGGLRLDTQESHRRQPHLPWPLSQLFAGRLQVQRTQDVWILVQAEASQSGFPPYDSSRSTQHHAQ